jgi:hypothetical protein
MVFFNPLKEEGSSFVAGVPFLGRSPFPMWRREASFEAYPVYYMLMTSNHGGYFMNVLTCNAFDQTSRTLPFAVVLETVYQFMEENALDFLHKATGVNIRGVFCTEMYLLETSVRWSASEWA